MIHQKNIKMKYYDTQRHKNNEIHYDTQRHKNNEILEYTKIIFYFD